MKRLISIYLGLSLLLPSSAFAFEAVEALLSSYSEDELREAAQVSERTQLPVALVKTDPQTGEPKDGILVASSKETWQRSPFSVSVHVGDTDMPGAVGEFRFLKETVSIAAYYHGYVGYLGMPVGAGIGAKIFPLAPFGVKKVEPYLGYKASTFWVDASRRYDTIQDSHGVLYGLRVGGRIQGFFEAGPNDHKTLQRLDYSPNEEWILNARKETSFSFRMGVILNFRRP